VEEEEGCVVCQGGGGLLWNGECWLLYLKRPTRHIPGMARAAVVCRFILTSGIFCTPFRPLQSLPPPLCLYLPPFLCPPRPVCDPFSLPPSRPPSLLSHPLVLCVVSKMTVQEDEPGGAIPVGAQEVHVCVCVCACVGGGFGF